MKKTFLAVLTALLIAPTASVFAQGKYGADSAECIKYLSYYTEYFKQKNYNDAMPNWQKAYELCPPTASQNLLINGATLVRRLIPTAKGEEQKALIETLLTLHEQRAQYYPKYAVTALNNKGLDMANYIKDDNQRLYDSYNAIIDANGAQTKPTILLFDLNCAIALYQDGKLDTESVINTYQKNMGILESATPKTDADKEQFASVKTDMESLFITSRVASCENLVALFTPRYEAAPQDLALVSNIVKMLGSTEGGTDTDLFFKAVTSMNNLDPSATSAYYLYKLNSGRGHADAAVKYLEEAIASPETDTATDAAYSYELALFCSKNGMNAKAYEAATTAMSLDESLTGKCYFVIGTIWGTNNCGGDEIQRRAHYWVAVDYMQKAKAADETLAEDANKLIGQYSKYYPQTAEAFMYDLTDGKSYTVACGGLRATTTVRTQK